MSASGKSRKSWRLLAAGGLTVALFGLIFWKVDWPAARKALGGAEWTWFAAAVLLFGVGLLLNSLRWHLALSLESLAVRRRVTTRAVFVGHFFNLLFFGFVGGDAAKTALYSRWHGPSAAKVLAACVVDRLFGIGGAVIFYLLLFCVISWMGSGGLGIEGLEWSIPVWLPMVGALAAAGLVMFVWKWPASRESFLGGTLASFRGNLRELGRAPTKAGLGLALGVGWHLTISAVMVLCLRSAGGDAIPWLDLIWVFPVVSVVTAVQVTVGGAGIREGASILLLGLYGIPPADALAAGILTSAVYFLWAIAGGILAGTEEHRHRRLKSEPAQI